MIYMWSSTTDWAAWLTDAFALYLVIEALAWLLGLFAERLPEGACVVGPGGPFKIARWDDDSSVGKISMAIMAASMGYMFVGMQLML